MLDSSATSQRLFGTGEQFYQSYYYYWVEQPGDNLNVRRTRICIYPEVSWSHISLFATLVKGFDEAQNDEHLKFTADQRSD